MPRSRSRNAQATSIGNAPRIPRSVHDSASSPGAYSSRFDTGPRRKQTLLSLLDLLSEVHLDGGLDAAYPVAMAADEKLQEVGAEQFFNFERRMENLDKEASNALLLRNFANAARQLGSSVGILSSAFKLREQLTKVLFLFRENAASLFPRKVTRHTRESLLNPNLMDRKRRRSTWRIHRAPPVAKLILEEDLQPETLPSQLESFATDVVTFLNCLSEFPEFTDEAVDQSMKSFEGDLKYWASCLNEYKTQFRSPAVQRYVHDLTTEIGDHIDNITVTLSMFIEIGVPTIRFHQQHAAANLLNLSTVATFFSAVTASTLQFSSMSTGTVLADAVNAFWFSSLVFSIAAAVNSLLGLTWKQAMYRSPGHRVPWWVLIWIKRSPLVFLVMSVACFSTGLMLFTYSSPQGPVTSTIITVLTAITSFGLVAVSAWFVSERWIFIQHRGQKWLGDVIAEFVNHVANLRLVRMARIAVDWLGTRVAIVCGCLRRAVEWINITPMRKEKDVLPAYNDPHEPQSFRHPRPPPNYRQDTHETILPLPHHEPAFSSCSDFTERPLSADDRSEVSVGSGQSNAKQRFVNAIRSVMMVQAASRPPMSPRRDSAWETPQVTSPGRLQESGVSALRNAQISHYIEKLKPLAPIQELGAHQALVRHLQFSPNGKFWLHPGGWDRTSVIFRVSQIGELSTHRVLVHVRGFIGQVAWSPNGKTLLTRLTRSVKVWTEVNGLLNWTIERQSTVQSIVWLPNSEGFLSVEGSSVVKLVRNFMLLSSGSSMIVVYRTWPGGSWGTYELGQVRLHNVAVTEDCQRLIGVGPSITRPDGPHPSRHTRVEKRLIVYNMLHRRKRGAQTPFANDVRDITMARRASVALISPEKSPPQLWELKSVWDRDNNCHTSRLSLKHTYTRKAQFELAGPCYFGGRDDQFVLCAGKAGDIHIWDRDTGLLLRYIRPQTPNSFGDLTCIAWNYGTDDTFMFATGSHDGAVRLWSTAAPPPVDDTKSESSSFYDRHMEGDRMTTFSLQSG
ncbi:hypothetical protein EDC04DRAFT_2590459 [Pisolithus marmoratus]|nr:hypothetical protein EDC04DRAFT_2590459 [Pisolithus marmoratus]